MVPLIAGIVLTVGMSCGQAAPKVKAGSGDKYKDAALDIALSSLQGLELASKVVEQQTAALETWKKIFGDDKAPHLETEHLLLYGAVPNKTLKDVGTLLERQAGLARKLLGMEKEEPWPGKLTVYFFTERARFTSFIRNVEKRRPESEDLGSYNIRTDFPHVAAGPPKEENDPSNEVQAAVQMASALLAKKGGTNLPDWLVAGFGRATYYRAAAPGALAAEKRRAAKLAPSATAMQVWNSTLDASAAAVLRGSLVDFLAFGPGKTRFLAFLAAFQPEEGKPTKTAEEALKGARMDPKIVAKKWKTWARSGK
jgi:hypothetical protein